ncbi:sensor histidine kinase, partial [Variovorax sp. 2RAF20]
ELTRESLGTRGFEDRVRLIDGTPVRCTVDRRRLDIVIGNLVANALAHGRPPVVMTVTGDDETAVLSVTDHGPPIPDDQRRRLFERFY